MERLDTFLKDHGDVLSGLVHCAATGVHKPYAELTGWHFDWMLGLNVCAFMELVKMLVPRF